MSKLVLLGEGGNSQEWNDFGSKPWEISHSFDLCMAISWYACSCVGVTYTGTHLQMCVSVWRSGDITYPFSGGVHPALRQGLSLVGLELVNQSKLLGQGTQRSACICLPSKFLPP